MLVRYIRITWRSILYPGKECARCCLLTIVIGECHWSPLNSNRNWIETFASLVLVQSFRKYFHFVDAVFIQHFFISLILSNSKKVNILPVFKIMFFMLYKFSVTHNYEFHRLKFRILIVPRPSSRALSPFPVYKVYKVYNVTGQRNVNHIEYHSILAILLLVKSLIDTRPNQQQQPQKAAENNISPDFQIPLSFPLSNSVGQLLTMFWTRSELVWLPRSFGEPICASRGPGRFAMWNGQNKKREQQQY